MIQLDNPIFQVPCPGNKIIKKAPLVRSHIMKWIVPKLPAMRQEEIYFRVWLKDIELLVSAHV